MAERNFSGYLSPFAWRYGSDEMRTIWSEDHKRLLWRRVWLALATLQNRWGVVSDDELTDIATHVDDVDVEASLAVEGRTRHDVVAELEVFAKQCGIGGEKLHLGATSSDIVDNAEAMRIIDALDIIGVELATLVTTLMHAVKAYADRPCLGFTHLQPADVTTVGYRLARYLQDLVEDSGALAAVRRSIRGKGFTGPVGTADAMMRLSERNYSSERVEKALGIPVYRVTTQVVPRKQTWRVITVLAGIAQSLHRMAFDWRLIASPLVGEIVERRGKGQVGSSAMPHKCNPILAEKVCSLARLVATFPRAAWDNAALSLLERTLDDSANMREVLPCAFLAVEECLHAAEEMVGKLQIDDKRREQNLAGSGALVATSRILTLAVKRGVDRRRAYRILREASEKGTMRVINDCGPDMYLGGFVCVGEVMRIFREARIGRCAGLAGVRARGMAREAQNWGIASLQSRLSWKRTGEK